MSKPIAKGSNDLRDYPHVDLLFPSDYITAADLMSRDVTVIIDKIEPRHELRRQNGKDYRPVVVLRGKAKKWVLNKTNAKTIARLYGPEVMGWIGKAVTLFPTDVPFGDRTVPAIRVRPRMPAMKGSAPAPAAAPEPEPEPDQSAGEDDGYAPMPEDGP